MSSLRNAVKRITHKERAQPRARAHLGILEKKQDYKKRAESYHKKEDELNRLKTVARNRNPDEFYFGMHKAQVDRESGQHRKLDAARQKEFELEMGKDVIKIMKGQDLAFVRNQIHQDESKVKKLKSSLHFDPTSSSSNNNNRHVVFVDNDDEADNFDPVEYFETEPELLGRRENRPRKAPLLENGNESDLGENVMKPKSLKKQQKERNAEINKLKRIVRARAAAYREMEAREERIEKMKRAESYLETERLVASKGRKRKIADAQDGRPAVYKWRRVRKR